MQTITTSGRPVSASAILRVEDPQAFRSRQVRVNFSHGRAVAEEVGAEMSFPEMTRLRRVPITPVEAHALVHSKNGFMAANLGVSAAITVELAGGRYAILATGELRDTGDCACKLISGYRASGASAFAEILREISEEVLLDDGRGVCTFVFDGAPAMVPFPILPASSSTVRLESTPVPRYVRATGGAPDWGFAKLFVDVPSHCAQAVFGFQISLREGAAWTLSRSNDALENGRLVTRLSEHPLSLLELTREDLPTGRVFTLQAGELREIDSSRILLSEAFCEGIHGVVPEPSILL